MALLTEGFPPMRLSLSGQEASFLIHPVQGIAFAKDDAHNVVNVPRIQSLERPSRKHTKGEHMQIRLLKNLSFVASVAALLVPAISIPVEAQKKESLWITVATVERVKKPNRQRVGSARKTQRVALLTLQWHLLKRTGDNTREEADPNREFQTGDRLKMAVTVNQTGYLYIVNRSQGKDPVLLFPDLRINKGQNNVLRNKEYVVPSYCEEYEDPEDCWFKIMPPTGTETLFVIFSRDKITTLPNKIAKPNSVVKPEVIDQLVSTSEKEKKQVTGTLRIPGQKAVRYATWAQNTNLKDNEELITTIEVRHGPPQ
jgi:hypothetical protein